MADKQLMERAEQALYKVYNRFPVVFDHGEGVKLYDTEGNEYLDFGAGIAVMALGYGDEEYTKAVEEQLHKLTHISNLFYNQPAVLLRLQSAITITNFMKPWETAATAARTRSRT